VLQSGVEGEVEVFARLAAGEDLGVVEAGAAGVALEALAPGLAREPASNWRSSPARPTESSGR
jgi:hypothetical protein